MTDLDPPGTEEVRRTRHLALSLRPIQLATVAGVAYTFKAGHLYKDGAKQKART